MLQKLKQVFNSIPVIGVTKRNFLMISADIRKGTVIVSYKGKIKTGVFDDKTLRHMMNGTHFDKNVSEFLNATGKLISKVIE